MLQRRGHQLSDTHVGDSVLEDSSISQSSDFQLSLHQNQDLRRPCCSSHRMSSHRTSSRKSSSSRLQSAKSRMMLIHHCQQRLQSLCFQRIQLEMCCSLSTCKLSSSLCCMFVLPHSYLHLRQPQM